MTSLASKADTKRACISFGRDGALWVELGRLAVDELMIRLSLGRLPAKCCSRKPGEGNNNDMMVGRMRSSADYLII